MNRRLFSGLRPLTLALLLYSACCPPAALAEKAFVDAVTLTATRDHLVVYFDVKQAFTKKIIEAVTNGVPTTFTFHIQLFQNRSSWFDKQIAAEKITGTLKYNTIREQFLLQRPWKSEEPLVVETLEAAQKKMTHIAGFNFIALENLIPGKKYQIRIKAEMKKIKLPLYLHHVLFFLSFWNFETEWHTMDFIY